MIQLDDELKSEILNLKTRYSFFASDAIQLSFLVGSSKGCFMAQTETGDFYLSQLDNGKFYKISNEGAVLWEIELKDEATAFSGRALISVCPVTNEVCVFDLKAKSYYFLSGSGEIKSQGKAEHLSPKKILLRDEAVYVCDTKENNIVLTDKTFSQKEEAFKREISTEYLVSDISWGINEKELYVCYLKYDHPQEYFVYKCDLATGKMSSIVSASNQGTTIFNLLLELDSSGNIYLFEKNGRIFKYANTGESIFSVNTQEKIRSVSCVDNQLYLSLSDRIEILGYRLNDE